VNGRVVWITGRPASGKSTLAKNLASELQRSNVPCCVLDGDDVRAALVPTPGYDAAARDEFYATLANLAALLARQELVVIVPATAHARAFRDRARERAPAFVEVLVDVSEDLLRARDFKGLYRQAAEGKLSALPGQHVAYEPPIAPDVVASGGEDQAAIARLGALLVPRPL
jgi:adenylylsulfate kinase